MADFADRASDQTERDREDALRAHQAEQERQARYAARLRGFDPSKPLQCVDCGEDIPPQRLDHNPHTRRCTQCASDIEARR